MAVNVVHYLHNAAPAWGVIHDNTIIPVSGSYSTTGEFLRNASGRAREAAARPVTSTLRLADVELLSPVTRNQQFICQAINYRSHMQESGIDPDAQPFNIFFRKASSCIVPANSAVARPTHVKLLDYEIEIGLVVGTEITHETTVTAGNLHQYVAALVIVNDVSARDVQLPQSQFYKGKSYRTFGPVGPYLTLVDAADLAHFDALHLSLWVNDELRQDAYGRDMVFKPAPTLTELSGMQDLFAGDLIATGTPGGCAARSPGRAIAMLGRLLPDHLRWANFVKMGLRNPKYLKPGDRMRATIRTDDGAIDLGVQHNEITDRPTS